MWNYGKPVRKMSAEEIRLQDAFSYLQEIEARLKKIEFVLDELYLKAQLSNLALTVQSVSEDQMERIKKILTESDSLRRSGPARRAKVTTKAER